MSLPRLTNSFISSPKRKLKLLFATFAWAVATVSALDVYGASRAWTGAVSSDWFNAANWQPNGVPAAGDSVTIGNNASVDVAQRVTVTELNLTGSLNGSGLITVSTTMNWFSGDIRAQIIIPASARLNISGAEGKTLRTGKLNNLGTVIWSGTGAIVGYAGGAITNAALFEFRNDSTFSFCCAHPIATFVNLPSGTIRKSVAMGDTIFGDFLLVNRGAVDIQSGALVLRGPEHQLNAGGKFSGAGRTRIGTSVVVNGASIIEAGGTVEQIVGGVLNGEGTLEGSGTFQWSGGEIRGKLAIGPQAKWLVSGSDGKSVIGERIQNAGTATWTGTGGITGFAGGRIENSGLFEAQNDALANFCCAHPHATFHNVRGGTFRKTGGTGQTVFDTFIFDNDGLVEVLKGTLVLGGGGTSSGSFSNAPSGSISFTAGTMVLNSSSTSALGGVNRIGPGATLTLNGTNTVPAGAKFTLAGGTLNGVGRLTGAGTFEWTGGDLRGELALSPETKAQISGAADKGIIGGRLRNEGTVVWTGSGAIVGYAGGSITNSGVFEMQNDAAFSFCCAHPMAVFDNGPKGTLRKTVATGASVFGDFLFHNEGLVDIQTGVLALRSQTHVFKAGGRFSGAGRTRIESAVNLAGASTLEAKGTVELRGVLHGKGGFDGPGNV